MLYTTGANALISVWDDKARWLFWRPITAIRQAASDGNPDTAAYTGSLPLIISRPRPLGPPPTRGGPGGAPSAPNPRRHDVIAVLRRSLDPPPRTTANETSRDISAGTPAAAHGRSNRTI